MTFQQEMDDVRQEVRRASTGAVRLWPKQDGLNVEATAGTWRAFAPGGVALDSGAATVEAFGAVSRLSAVVSAPAAVGENFRAEFTYTTAAGTFTESVHFDVVVEPVGTIGVSLNDFLSEQADAQPILQRQASMQEAGRTAQQQAAILALRAWGDIRAILKRKVEQGGGRWPLYIVNREDLRRVVTAQAMHRMIIAQGVTSPDLREQAEWWRSEAERRFAAMPELQYSHDDDAEPDAVVASFAIVETRRSW